MHFLSEFWHEYFEILTDPAHWAAEVTQDLIIFLCFAPFGRKLLERHDRKHHAGHVSGDVPD